MSKSTYAAKAFTELAIVVFVLGLSLLGNLMKLVKR